MTNSYCENKSKKPVITKYDPSKNYMVQMVESLASIDYPNENHIYVIESTGEKYIYYNGAFAKFEATDSVPFYPVLVLTGNSYLNWSVSNYTHGTCRTHIEVNGTLCPIFIVKIGVIEYEILQIEKGNGQPHVYAYFRLIRDGNQNITDIQYIKFQLNLQTISEIQANTTVYGRQDGGMLRGYYWDRTTSEYTWFGIVNSSYKWAIGNHEENQFSLYAQVSADQFIQVTNLGNSTLTLDSKFYEVQAIQF